MHDHATMGRMVSVGIMGASGFAGSELLRLAAGHPDLKVAWATGDSQAGVAIADLYPGLAAHHPNDVFLRYEPALLDGVDGVFVALPHGASQHLVDDVVS